MNENGFHFTFESGITLLLAITLVTSLHLPEPQDIGPLLVKQKQHDLLAVWILSRDFDKEHMERDFRLVFPQSGGFIEINGEKVFIGRQSDGISIENAVYVDEDLQLRTISVGVYR